MFHATVLVTRAEELVLEATAEEARELLAQGHGHRCHLGDRLTRKFRNSMSKSYRKDLECCAFRLKISGTFRSFLG